MLRSWLSGAPPSNQQVSAGSADTRFSGGSPDNRATSNHLSNRSGLSGAPPYNQQVSGGSPDTRFSGGSPDNRATGANPSGASITRGTTRTRGGGAVASPAGATTGGVPPRLRQAEERFRALGVTSSVGGFVCIAEVSSTSPTGSPSLVGIIVNAPSVGRDADKVAAEDLGLEPDQSLHDGLPICPEAISFVAASLCDSTRSPNANTGRPTKGTSASQLRRPPLGPPTTLAAALSLLGPQIILALALPPSGAANNTRSGVVPLWGRQQYSQRRCPF
jgi:hypothetical protein